jgi:histone deacetylase 1/2
MDDSNQDEDLIPPDTRRPRMLLDSRRQGDGELSDSDDEGEGGRRNHAHHRDRDRSRSSEPESNSQSNGSGRKFGLGVGIMMSSGQAASTHGAGPSGHMTTARTLSMGGGNTSMDLDDASGPPTRSGSTDPVSAIPPREKSTERLPETNGDTSEMVVDQPP